MKGDDNTAPAFIPARDRALQSAAEAHRLISEASELIYSCDRDSPTLFARSAAIKMQAARRAVEQMLADYNRVADIRNKQP